MKCSLGSVEECGGRIARFAALCLLVASVAGCSLIPFPPTMTLRLKAGPAGARFGRGPGYPKCVLFTATSPTTPNSVSSAELGGLSPTCLHLKGFVSPVVSAEVAKSTGVQFTLPTGQYDITPIGIETTGSCSTLATLFAGGSPDVYLLGSARTVSASQSEISILSTYTSSATSLTAACASGSGINVLAAGGYQTCAAYGGAPYCWGANTSGQLGDDTYTDHSAPAVVLGISSGVSAMATGAFSGHTCAIVAGALQCWGNNSHGQLGNGTTLASPRPGPVSGQDTNVTAVAVGSYNGHTCSIKGTAMYCWGENGLGQGGNGGFSDQLLPFAVIGMGTSPTSISTGSLYGHTCGVQSGGVYCWGNNANGQLGDGSTNQSPLPVGVSTLGTNVVSLGNGGGGAHNCALGTMGVYCWGDNVLSPAAVVGLAGTNDGVTALAVGSSFNCAIKNGALFCWGANSFGQLGDNSTTGAAVPIVPVGMDRGVTDIACGSDHTCAVKDAQLYCWGRNHRGQLGIGTLTEAHVPTLVIRP